MANTEGMMRGRCSKEGRPPGGPCIRRHGNPSGTERREPRARQLATSAPIKLLVCTSHDPAPTIVTRAIVWCLVVVVAAAGERGARRKAPVSQAKKKETEMQKWLLRGRMTLLDETPAAHSKRAWRSLFLRQVSGPCLSP